MKLVQFLQNGGGVFCGGNVFAIIISVVLQILDHPARCHPWLPRLHRAGQARHWWDDSPKVRKGSGSYQTLFVRTIERAFVWSSCPKLMFRRHWFQSRRFKPPFYVWLSILHVVLVFHGFVSRFRMALMNGSMSQIGYGCFHFRQFFSFLVFEYVEIHSCSAATTCSALHSCSVRIIGFNPALRIFRIQRCTFVILTYFIRLVAVQMCCANRSFVGFDVAPI